MMARRRPRRAGMTAVALGVLAAASLAAGGGADGRQAREHQIFVTVVDGDGAPVTDLGADEFVVREDGVAREVLRVGPATAPMDVAVLVDDSAAATRAIADLRKGLQAFAGEMVTGNQISLITFGERPTILVDYTATPAQLEAGINRIFSRPGTGAYLLEAIVEAARGLARRDPARPVMVVVTTEGQEFSNDYHTKVLEALHESRAIMYALVLSGRGDNPQSDEIRNRNIVLADGPATTGGRRDFLLAETSITPKLQQVASQLKHQYRLVYSRPESLIPPRTLAVAARRPGLTALAPTVPGER